MGGNARPVVDRCEQICYAKGSFTMLYTPISKWPGAVGSSPDRETQEPSPMPNPSITQPIPTEQGALLRANTAEAALLWARRTGVPLYSYTQTRAAWPIACPHCGLPRLLEVTDDSENGTYMRAEPCACGSVP